MHQYASAKVTFSQLQEMADDNQVVRMERPGKVASHKAKIVLR